MTKNYVAQLTDNIVDAIIVADYEWVAANLAGVWQNIGPEPLTVAIGYIYDPATNTFTPPPQADNDNE